MKIAKRESKHGLLLSAGFPMKELDRYLGILIDNNKSIGIVDQTGTDHLSSSKRLTRSITRIISPGTVLSNTTSENSFLLSLKESNSSLAIAWADITTAEFYISNTTNLYESLLKIAPKEVLIATDLFISRPDLYKQCLRASLLLGFKLTENNVKQLILDLPINQDFKSLINPSKNSNNFDSIQVYAATHILAYISKMFPLLNYTTHFQSPTAFTKDKMILDGSVLRTLELTQTIDGLKTNTLFKSIDRTTTASGSRLLLSRLSKMHNE